MMSRRQHQMKVGCINIAISDHGLSARWANAAVKVVLPVPPLPLITVSCFISMPLDCTPDAFLHLDNVRLFSDKGYEIFLLNPDDVSTAGIPLEYASAISSAPGD